MKAETLRKSILQYAIQGKLVSQIETEEAASVLLEKIKAEKQELIKQGKIKKSKPLAEITDSEKPFDIPDSWQWVRLDSIVYNHGQKTPTEKFSYIDISSINNKKQCLSDKENIIEAQNAPSRARKIVKSGDILYATVRPYLHNMCIIDGKFSYEPIASTGFAVLKAHTGVNSKYLFYYLLSPEFDLYANDTENSKGVAYPAINDTKLYKAVIALPPISEQQRIVAGIEKLMALVDEYEKKEIELTQLEKDFPEKLKKSILQHAIKGKLVLQIETEEPVRILIEKIKEEKQKLIKQGKIKKSKPLAEITDEEKPFDIPDSWEWVRLGELAEYKKGPFGSSLTKAIFVKPSNSAIKVYEQKNAINKNWRLGDYYISEEKYETMHGFTVKSNDIIVSCAGTIGETYVLPQDAPMGIINQALMRVRLHYANITDFYLIYFDYIVTIASKLGGNGSAMKNIPPLDELKNLLMPLPPLQEQKRILNNIEYIYSLIDLVAQGKKLKQPKVNKRKIETTVNVIDFPVKDNRNNFDVHSLGVVARAENGVDKETVASVLKQVQEFYDKKN